MSNPPLTRPRTAPEIVADFITMLRDTPLSNATNGHIYPDGLRPRNSQLQDTTVIFTSGTTLPQDTGIITIHIYTPDIDPFLNGIYVQDTSTTTHLANLAQQWVDHITPWTANYHITQQDTIAVAAAPQLRQHIIVIMLRYTYYDTINNH